MPQNFYNKITKFVFLSIASIHAIRMILGWQIIIGSWEVPFWVSVLILFFSSFFAHSVLK
ncbi:hypothetical protein A2159_02055 [Candidatus Woesebacteria bacterium RBG_13_34_9]|uniref:Uncharacterized protein n=1 Tax=Candidatus Woesebacteria bacterium RBG_13_34_9 TaxID=1802477 RepID=A0A1F7X1V8_9BACT|nr:MAG: hypothetical protein A2159_02055 [Candidatus Woesebacteria bacterium RBG_13_34_9]